MYKVEMDINQLVLSLKSLQGNKPWDLQRVASVVTEIAVISKNPSVDTVLPVVLSVIDKVKEAALSKLGPTVSSSDSDEISLQFDELKIVAKHVVPAIVKAVLLEQSFFARFSCCSSVNVVKVIDQTATVLQAVDSDLKAAELVEKAVTGNSNVTSAIENVVSVVEEKVEDVQVVEKMVEADLNAA